MPSRTNTVRKEQTIEDYAYQHQLNEQPSIIPCSGPTQSQHKQNLRAATVPTAVFAAETKNSGIC